MFPIFYWLARYNFHDFQTGLFSFLDYFHHFCSTIISVHVKTFWMGCFTIKINICNRILSFKKVLKKCENWQKLFLVLLKYWKSVFLDNYGHSFFVEWKFNKLLKSTLNIHKEKVRALVWSYRFFCSVIQQSSFRLFSKVQEKCCWLCKNLYLEEKKFNSPFFFVSVMSSE